MRDPQTVRELAMSLLGTEERDHCGIPSFRVRKIYATLWAEEGFVNLELTPEMQHELVAEAPHIFAPIPNKWGLRGSTRVELSAISAEEMLNALRLAWSTAQPLKASKKRP